MDHAPSLEAAKMVCPRGCPLTLNSASSTPALAAIQETPTPGWLKDCKPGHTSDVISLLMGASDTTHISRVENGGSAGFSDLPTHSHWQGQDSTEV